MSQIGIENFKRYLWDNFMKYMSKADTENGTIRKDVLLEEITKLRMNNNAVDLFSSVGLSVDNTLSFNWDSTLVSYKYL